jgi:hypothetical protein
MTDPSRDAANMHCETLPGMSQIVGEYGGWREGLVVKGVSRADIADTESLFAPSSFCGP